MVSVDSWKVAAIVDAAKKAGKSQADIDAAMAKAGITQGASWGYVGVGSPAIPSTSKNFTWGDPGIADNPAAYWSKINAKGETVRDPMAATTPAVKLNTPATIDTSALNGVKGWSAIADMFKQQYGALSWDIQAIAKQLWDTTGIFESKIKTALMKADETRAIQTSLNQKLQDSFWVLEGAQSQKYQDILNRINKQEGTIDSKFGEMKSNLDTIKTGYEAQQEAGDQASSIAASRQLRGLGGESGQIIASGMWQARARTSMLNMVKLDADLAEQANTLTQNYLQLKNTVMQDANLNDSNRQNILNTLNDKFNAIAQLQWGTEQQYTEAKFAPVTQMQDTLINQKLGQYVNEGNQKWMNTSPAMRESQIQQILWTALSSKVKVPASVVANARNAGTATDMMNYLYNYIVTNIPKANTNSSGMSAISALLSAQWGASSAASTGNSV